jgi:GNAT superfamily N-acetyltransferase
MTAATLRRAVPGDASAVLRLFDEAIAWFVQIGNTGQWGEEPFSGQPRWEARAADWCAGPDSWVATHPELGLCGALVLGDAADTVPAGTQPELYVRVLIGSRAPRAKGTGRRLLALADERAAAAGVELLRVDCYAGGSGELVRFYESCGFDRAETFTVGDWPGQLLTRRLGSRH